MSTSDLDCLLWETVEPVEWPGGQARVRGTAVPQVRSAAKLAELGPPSGQAAQIKAIIVEGLTQLLQSLQPTGAQVEDMRQDIASTTLVAANQRLRSYGVVLLDLSVTELQVESKYSLG